MAERLTKAEVQKRLSELRQSHPEVVTDAETYVAGRDYIPNSVRNISPSEGGWASAAIGMASGTIESREINERYSNEEKTTPEERSIFEESVRLFNVFYPPVLYE